MSLQLSHPQSAQDHVLGSIGVSAIDGRQAGLPEHSGERGMMLSLVHLDVALAIEAPTSEARKSSGGRTGFKVSAKRLAGVSVGADHEVADGKFADPVMRRLADALAATEAAHDQHSPILADALRLAILTRRASRPAAIEPVESDPVDEERARCVRSLQKWRLKRVEQYIDENLGGKVTLENLAAVAGLSRMHFAAQFRAAVGMRPHEYLLKRRIERAQELLKQANASLVDVALTVGFQTQAHFTTVFKRFAGDTPYQWRSAHLAQFLPMPRAEMGAL
jgi:AraC-like DNA-binding protein